MFGGWRARLIAAGISLFAIHLGLAFLIRTSEAGLTPGQTWVSISVLLAAGLIWMTSLLLGSHQVSTAATVAALALGLLMRLCYFGGPAFHEVDFNRYLWDGAVTAKGLDPYAEPPSNALAQRVTRSVSTHGEAQSRDWALADLADEAGAVFDGVRYNDLKTIYPPGAQLAFAIASLMKSFSLDVWRCLILAAEMLTMALLLLMLGHSARPRIYALLYWWNPLLIVQFAASAHMDALICPLLLATLWATWQQRNFLATIFLAVASAIKLWPLLLLPLAAGRGTTCRRYLATSIWGLILSAVMLWPQLRHLGEGQNGLTLFALHWERNSFAFPLLLEVIQTIAPSLESAANWSRILAAACVLTVTLVSLRAHPVSLQSHARSFALPVAALLLLAPTGFPWYYSWLLPLLCFWANPALILLGVLMALYYAGFALKPADGPEYWPYWVRTIEFLPIWIGLLLWQLRRRKSQEPELR